jgi:uncharacterized membrane protein (UPF0127 family)
MRLARAAFLLLGMGSGCDKAPAELPPMRPAPPLASSGPVESGTVRLALSKPRCVRPMSVAPEAAPRYRLDPACPTDPAGGSPMVPIGHVSFPESRAAPRLEVELMLTEKHQARGLMYRKSLAEDKGMLFVWKLPSMHAFWMHNTCIPLDMLFIDDEGYIAGIVENAPTLNDGSRAVTCPASYVLEVNAGWSRQHGVEPGQKVLIEGVPAL